MCSFEGTYHVHEWLSGGVSPCQGEGRGFESRLVLLSGCGSAWLERLIWDQEAAGSNPVTPMMYDLHQNITLFF